MGAIKPTQALLSFIVWLYAGLLEILPLENKVGIHPYGGERETLSPAPPFDLICLLLLVTQPPQFFNRRSGPKWP